MFKVLIIRHIHSCLAAISSGDVFVHRWLDLPFPPYLGLTICFPDDSDRVDLLPENRDKQIHGSQIVWNVAESRFDVYCEPCTTLYYRGLHTRPPAAVTHEGDFLRIVGEHLSAGWKLGWGDRELTHREKEVASAIDTLQLPLFDKNQETKDGENSLV